MIEEAWCLWCGEPLPDDRPWAKIYCGRTCQQKATNRIRTERRRAKTVKPRDCGWCGKPLPPDRHPRTIFCNAACQTKAAGRRRVERRHAEVLTPRSCLWCGTTYKPKRSDTRLCSRECQMARWRAHQDPAEKRAYDRQRLEKVKAAQPMKPCAWCGTMFQPSGRKRRSHRFCSRSCISKNRWERDRVAVEPRNCAHCGKEFMPVKPSSRIRHCSRWCGTQSRKKVIEPIICQQCGKAFTPKRSSRKKPKFCSRPCFLKSVKRAGD